MLRGECFALRDASYYYYPMFQWTADQWQQGELPFWNPLSNLGLPVTADATASLFYPAKGLLFIPGLKFGFKFFLYTAVHVLLAGGGAYALARQFRVTQWGSLFSAVSYAFGGAVLFQTCNVIFLIGASWLPWGLLTGFLALQGNRGYWIWCALVLAMMVLGGEPQMAYHCLLALSMLVLIRWRKFKQDQQAETCSEKILTKPTVKRLWSSKFVRGMLSLSVIGLLALGLSAIQVIPSAIWSARSQRSTFETPRSIYEVPEYLRRSECSGFTGVSQGLWQSPSEGTHHHHIYQFSNPPWVIAELFFPNISGRIAPVNQRWTNALPNADRTWTPSVYLGLLPAVFGLCCLSLRKRSVEVCWLSWLLLFFLVGSFGWYGVGWVIHEVAYGFFGMHPDQIPVSSSFGGIYWWMVKILPGYVSFRYPAKLFVVAALSLSVLGGIGFDRIIVRTVSRRFEVLLYVIAAVALIGFMFVILFAPAARNFFASVYPDPQFGPVDPVGTLAELRIGFLQSFIVSCMAIVGWRLLMRKNAQSSRSVLLQLGFVALTAAEIVCANRGLIETAPYAAFEQNSLVAATVHQQATPSPMQTPPRVFRGQIWLPPQWSRTSSQQRLAESMQFEQETLFPNQHLQHEIAVVETFSSIEPYDYWAFMAVARSGGFAREDGLIEPNEQLLELLGSEFVILPRYSAATPSTAATDALVLDGADFQVLKLAQAFPRCWMVNQWQVLPELISRDPQEIGARTRKVLLDKNSVRDFRQIAMIESDRIDIATQAAGTAPTSDALSVQSCEITHFSTKQMTVHVTANQPSLLIINDYFDPGWQATIRSSDSNEKVSAPILRTNRIMRGVLVSPGTHQVEFQFQPVALQYGIWISLCSFLFSIMLLLWFKFQTRSAIQS
jgi:hypothetical protein